MAKVAALVKAAQAVAAALPEAEVEPLVPAQPTTLQRLGAQVLVGLAVAALMVGSPVPRGSRTRPAASSVVLVHSLPCSSA